MEKDAFIKALEEHSLAGVEQIPKSDLHSHAGRGGNIAYIENMTGAKIMPPSAPFESLEDMNRWLNDNVKCHFPDGSGYLQRIEAAFAQARKDHIAVLSLSYAADEIDAVVSTADFMRVMDGLHREFAPDMALYPDLTIYSAPDIDRELDRLEEIFSHHWFKGVDIINYSGRMPMADMKKICQKARDHGMLLKAHVGEFGTADDVLQYAEELALDEVQHGIAAAASPQNMNWLAQHRIRLNVCPTSNVLLKNAGCYRTHPIRTLFDYGVPVTINSDDLLIFNASVSQEYLNLYEAGLMNAEELNAIRETGLSHQYS